jgi:preprotein translocase subunit SecD
MNRYPLWKNATVIIALVFGLLYTLPNFFGEVPAVQVSSVKATVKVEPALMSRIADVLKTAGIADNGFFEDANSIRVRFADTDPQWLSGMHALPMYLGLDLRGGVHFLLQVDMKGALTKRLDSTAADMRAMLRDKNIRHSGITRDGQSIVIKFRDAEMQAKGRDAILDTQPAAVTGRKAALGPQPDLAIAEGTDANDLKLTITLTEAAQKRVQEMAVKQNIGTLHNRINELGVAEPVIQQQGADRIVVELPGVQDTAKAKDILGRTATLELRMVDDENSANASVMDQAARGQPPVGDEFYIERGGRGLLVKKQVMLTGERLTDAQPGFDNQTHEPAVHLSLDSAGSRIFRDLTRDNVGKRMAILLIEKGKGEVVTAPVIRSEIGGGRVQISGRMTTQEASDVALLLRAGSLAAPMEIVEERTIGPSLGAENIKKGFDSTVGGFAAIAVFMMAYYLLFGLVSVLALSANMLFLVALLSLLQATLTLPGIAAIALALGMAIDSNVLINERIREELRGGNTPQAAILAGYERAWATIIDSNVTTLIVGIALLIFGSGPVRGFAVVHCLGILTSLFSSVVLSRALVNLIYGKRKKLASLSIGQVWRPGLENK